MPIMRRRKKIKTLAWFRRYGTLSHANLRLINVSINYFRKTGEGKVAEYAEIGRVYAERSVLNKVSRAVRINY